MTIEPFTIHATDDQLDDLRRRLTATRFPDAELVDDWSQGTPLSYLTEVVNYWATEYDWRTREAALNRWAGYRTAIAYDDEVDPVDIHFLHVRSPEPNAAALIMTHGWPGSIVEFQKVLGPLTDPTNHGGDAADAFHVVCPTIPGYGFSGKPTSNGWGVGNVARAWDRLMIRLGYDSYFAQGGDWGSAITTQIGVQNLGHCQAIHVNMPIVSPDPETMDDLTEAEKSALAGYAFYQDHDSGYSKQQGTRPQSIGYGLADSPAGQAAWILEKYHRWMDCRDHPENVASRDELLDNIMFYWLTNSATSSARLYWESFNKMNRDPVELPTGMSIFPKEIFRTSQRWARKRFPTLIHFNELTEGGHFAAFEQPEVFVDEVRTCFRNIR